MDNKEYIQLPPIKRGTDPNLVKMMWVYVQLPEKEQEEVETHITWLDKVKKGQASRDETDHVLASERTIPFTTAMREVLGDIILETSQFACWLYQAIYVEHITVKQLLQEYPESKDLILIMSQMFEDLKMKDFQTS